MPNYCIGTSAELLLSGFNWQHPFAFSEVPVLPAMVTSKVCGITPGSFETLIFALSYPDHRCEDPKRVHLSQFTGTRAANLKINHVFFCCFGSWKSQIKASIEQRREREGRRQRTLFIREKRSSKPHLHR